jgi:hypothetical protein
MGTRSQKEGSYREVQVRWKDICRGMRAMGHMQDFSKGECWRVAKELSRRVQAGQVRKVSRGLYAVRAD